MTDERIDDLIGTIDRLPRGSGIVFRHYETPARERRTLFAKVRRRAASRGHVLLLAGPPLCAWQWRADGAHSRSVHASLGIRSAAAHNGREMAAALRARADLIFLSPACPTRSHLGAHALGPVKLGLIAGTMRRGVVALGGMNARRWRRFRSLGLHGWAAIDGLTDQKRTDQKRNAVPT